MSFSEFFIKKETEIKISISTSNGDEEFFRPQTGITVVYAGK